MTDINIAELRAIAEAATPGPREVVYDPDDDHDSGRRRPSWWVKFKDAPPQTLYRDSTLMREADAIHFATFDREFCLGLLDKLGQLLGTCREALIVIVENRYSFPEDVMKELMTASQEWDALNPTEDNDEM